jgi:hypothetical protein
LGIADGSFLACGAALRVEPLTGETVEEQDGWMVIPASREPITERDVQALRDADQR